MAVSRRQSAKISILDFTPIFRELSFNFVNVSGGKKRPGSRRNRPSAYGIDCGIMPGSVTDCRYQRSSQNAILDRRRQIRTWWQGYLATRHSVAGMGRSGLASGLTSLTCLGACSQQDLRAISAGSDHSAYALLAISLRRHLKHGTGS